MADLLLDTMRTMPPEGMAFRVCRWIRDRDIRRFTSRDLGQRFPGLSYVERESLLLVLVESGIIKKTPPRPFMTGRPPSPAWEVVA